MTVAERLDSLGGRRSDAGGFGAVHRLPERHLRVVGEGHQLCEGRVADPAARPVRDRQERHRVVRIVDHLEICDEILDLRALVEPRAADHLVRNALADEHVLEHAALRVRPVEDGDLVAVDSLLRRALRSRRRRSAPRSARPPPRRRDRIAVAELRPEVLRLALAVVRDDAVRGFEDRVCRAVVLLECDRLRAREVAFELEHVADVRAAERVDRLIWIAHGEDVRVLSLQAAAGTGTAHGSCPGTRRRAGSGTRSAISPAPRGSASSTSTVR